MTTTGTDLLAAILTDPANDAVRLVYADWLEEQEQRERAEFIRVQIKWSKLTPDDLRCLRNGKPTAWYRWTKACRCQVCKMRRMEYETSKRHSVWDWCKCAVLCHPIYRRGFVDEVSCTCAEWMQDGPGIVAVQPVTAVALTDKRPLEANLRDGQYWDFFRKGFLGNSDAGHVLPAEIFDLMTTGFVGYGEDGDCVYRLTYNDRKKGIAAAQTAALLWARQTQLASNEPPTASP